MFPKRHKDCPTAALSKQKCTVMVGFSSPGSGSSISPYQHALRLPASQQPWCKAPGHGAQLCSHCRRWPLSPRRLWTSIPRCNTDTGPLLLMTFLRERGGRLGDTCTRGIIGPGKISTRISKLQGQRESKCPSRGGHEGGSLSKL